MKTPIPNSCQMYESKEHGRHTLYCGTEILQTRFYGNKHVLALVIRTGFSTTKGAVMRTLLYPAHADHKFEQHSYKFVMFLAVIAVIGFTYTVVTKVEVCLRICRSQSARTIEEENQFVDCTSSYR